MPDLIGLEELHGKFVHQGKLRCEKWMQDAFWGGISGRRGEERGKGFVAILPKRNALNSLVLLLTTELTTQSNVLGFAE